MHWPNFDPRRWRYSADEQSANDSPHTEKHIGTIETKAATPLAPHLALGRRGEELAAAYLEQHGYILTAANVMLPVGRSLRNQLIYAEIDIVAYEAGTLCFVEVKTRASDWYAAPETNVDLRKQRQISRAARVYRRTFGLLKDRYRYDVMSVILPHASEEGATAAPNPRMKLLRNYWTDEKFRKRRWASGAYDD